jgi:hypothetical protein
MLWPKLEFRDGEDATAIKARFAKLRVQFPDKGPFWAATEAFKGLPYAIERGGAAATLWEQDAEICELRDRLAIQLEDDDVIDTPEKYQRAVLALYRDKYMCPKRKKVQLETLQEIRKANGWGDDGGGMRQPGGNALPTITFAAYPDDPSSSNKTAA